MALTELSQTAVSISKLGNQVVQDTERIRYFANESIQRGLNADEPRTCWLPEPRFLFGADQTVIVLNTLGV